MSEERRERLIRARVEAGFRAAADAARQHGWPESTYRAHEAGGRGFKEDDAIRYAKAFGVQLNWLWHGRGQVAEPREETPEKPKSSGPSLESAQFSSAPSVVSGYASTEPSGRLIPVYGRVHGGDGGFLMLDGTVSDLVACPPSLVRVSEAYALRVVGDSMEPRYMPGETVYVHPTRPYNKGDFVVVQRRWHDDVGGFIKRYIGHDHGTREIVLAQLNPPGDLRVPIDEVVAIHRIVASGQFG